MNFRDRQLKPRYRCDHLKDGSRPVKSEVADDNYNVVLCVDCDERWERGDRLMATADGKLFFVEL